MERVPGQAQAVPGTRGMVPETGARERCHKAGWMSRVVSHERGRAPGTGTEAGALELEEDALASEGAALEVGMADHKRGTPARARRCTEDEACTLHAERGSHHWHHSSQTRRVGSHAEEKPRADIEARPERNDQRVTRDDAEACSVQIPDKIQQTPHEDVADTQNEGSTALTPRLDAGNTRSALRQDCQGVCKACESRRMRSNPRAAHQRRANHPHHHYQSGR